jgi:hypothetical protein
LEARKQKKWMSLLHDAWTAQFHTEEDERERVERAEGFRSLISAACRIKYNIMQMPNGYLT